MLAAPVLSWTNCIFWRLQNAASGINKVLKKQRQNSLDRQSMRLEHEARDDAQPIDGHVGQTVSTYSCKHLQYSAQRVYRDPSTG